MFLCTKAFLIFSSSEGIHTVQRVGVLRHSGDVGAGVCQRWHMALDGAIPFHQGPRLHGSCWRVGGPPKEQAPLSITRLSLHSHSRDPDT